MECLEKHTYLIVDILYVADCLPHLQQLQEALQTSNEHFQKYKNELFPYAEGNTIGVYTSPINLHCINWQEKIQKVTHVNAKQPSTFCSDTGEIVIINSKSFSSFCKNFDYDLYIDNLTSSTKSYLRVLKEQVGENFTFVTLMDTANNVIGGVFEVME